MKVRQTRMKLRRSGGGPGLEAEEQRHAGLVDGDGDHVHVAAAPPHAELGEDAEGEDEERGLGHRPADAHPLRVPEWERGERVKRGGVVQPPEHELVTGTRCWCVTCQG